MLYQWFHKEDGLRYNDSANVKCLNPFVFRKFVEKETKIRAYNVEITPHRQSLEGNDKPFKKLLIKFGFEDTNTCLVNTIEAIQNQIQEDASTTNGDDFTIMKEAIEEDNKKFKLEIKKDMKKLNDDILKEAYIYADEIND